MEGAVAEEVSPDQRHPRRVDRSMTEEGIRTLLEDGGACVLSAVLDGRPFSLPRIYVYDPSREAVYVHGAHGGETGRVMETEEDGGGVPVNLTVFEMGRLLPAPEALEFGLEYASVVVRGRAFEVEDEEEALEALGLLMEKYAPHLEAGKDYRAITPEEVARTSVLRIRIESWSGKEKVAAPDFPGAYRWRDLQDLLSRIPPA